jgi:hypothetical protein
LGGFCLPDWLVFSFSRLTFWGVGDYDWGVCCEIFFERLFMRRLGIVFLVFFGVALFGLESWLPVGFRSFCEWDDDRGVFVGMMVVEGEKRIVEVDGDTGEMLVVGGVPEMDGWIGNGSALLREKRVFACLGIEDGRHTVCLIPLDGNGERRTVGLDVPVTVLGGIEKSGVIVGLGRVEKIYRLVSIDVESLKVEVVMTLPRLERISGGAFWHAGLERLLLLGVVDGGLRLVSVDVEGKTFEVLDGDEVGLDEFRVGKGVLFTAGVQACTAVAGICPKSGVGWLTHVSHRNQAIEAVLDKMMGEIKQKVGGTPGMNETELVLAGGVKGQAGSEGNLRRADLRLTGEHWSAGRKIKQFSTSTSWNVVIYKGEILVF